jgi:hypothetical protein
MKTWSVREQRGVSEWTHELSGVLDAPTITSVSSQTRMLALHSGRVKRRRWGLKMRSKRMLTTPER